MASYYTLVPRPIRDFAGLDLTARCVFGLIYDRWLLSMLPDNTERFTDTMGVYCLYSREAMAHEVGVSLPTLRRALKVLNERGLVYSRVLSNGEPVRYYVTRNSLNSLDDARASLLPPYHLNPEWWHEHAKE